MAASKKPKNKKQSSTNILDDFLGMVKGAGHDVTQFSKWWQGQSPNLPPHLQDLSQIYHGLTGSGGQAGHNPNQPIPGPNTKGLPNEQFPNLDPMQILAGQILSALQPAAKPITDMVANYSKDLAPFESMMPSNIADIYKKNAPDIQSALGNVLATTTDAASKAPQAGIMSNLLNALQSYATSQASFYSNPDPLKAMFSQANNPGIQQLLGQLGQIGTGVGIGGGTGTKIAPNTTPNKTPVAYPSSLPQ